MDRVPTYQDINRARAEQSSVQNQLDQRDALSKEVQSMNKPNPVLTEYMNRTPQQGLTPREYSAGAYTMFATNVANKVDNQETYSLAMIDAALKGQVSIGAVMEDDSILPEYKQGLINSMNSQRGLGQIR